jgi:hypothetical protein
MLHLIKPKMKITFTILTIVGILTSCGVPQTDYDKLKDENEQLQKEISELKVEKSEITVLNDKPELKRKNKPEIKKKIASNHSEDEAITILDDYYDFYNADMTYRNPRVRRVNGNTFKISLEDCQKTVQDNDFFWSSHVLTLIINDDGTYKINE